MIDFHTPTLEDKSWVDSVLSHKKGMSCAFTFAQMYLWSIHYGTQIARFGDCLLGRGGTDHPKYYYPSGKYDIAKVIEVLSADAAERGEKLDIILAEEWQVSEIEQAFPGRFVCSSDRDDCDYIYNASDLIELPGRKYHGKRNHIARFMREHPDWSYEPINDENTEECIKACHIWHDARTDADDSLMHERIILQKALEERGILGLNGGLIRCDGQVAAFTLGEPLNSDTYVVHFEKALPGYEGAYPLINNQFAVNELGAYKYINREEDLGSEGLRKAKLSYRPVILLDKFNLSER